MAATETSASRSRATAPAHFPRRPRQRFAAAIRSRPDPARTSTRDRPVSLSTGGRRSERRTPCRSTHPDRAGSPRHPTRARAGEPRGPAAACATCTTGSRFEPATRPSARITGSCRRHAPARAPRRSLPCRRARLTRSGFTSRGQRVKPASGTIFTSGDFGIFPSALEHPHGLEPAKGAIERAVRSQQPPFRIVRELPGQFVSMEFLHAAPAKSRGAGTNRLFDWHERAWFPSHADIISRYMLFMSTAILSNKYRLFDLFCRAGSHHVNGYSGSSNDLRSRADP
jgi:hypothetical protein